MPNKLSVTLEPRNLILPEELRSELKKPIGELLEKNPTKQLLSRINRTNPPLTVFVGDYCTLEALKQGYIPNISIIDGKNLREPFRKITIPDTKIIKLKNPAGEIRKKAWLKLRKVIAIFTQKKSGSNKTEPQNVVVKTAGEEDLLVLPVVVDAPLETLIVYGQPHKGVVIIKVTLNIKLKCKKIIERMRKVK
ncbi:MAG: DUF359 domain-containing protein [Asgard group archaeon]|nr:DUF359 domain-containing protein [Asgard group archaeon]